ncbi:FUSC family protein [Nocardia wallacei]|uniref:FUSC family protein n=1 Tax=Nocardia wallacei TaxID=480035 RepID=UPI0024572686|nr:FUSC family protein [Nocardia wallacei]
MSAAEPLRQPRIRPLPLSGVLRVNRPSDIWFKPATSVAVAFTLVLLPLLLAGRGELAVYVMPGAFCALYGHQLPYAARIRTTAWVVAGMTASMAVALIGASLVDSVGALIAIAAVVAGVQKAVCDATRIGPPGHVIFVFVTSGTLFAPQELREVPFHLALTIAAGCVGAAVALAPALIRREGPERRATARALDAAAAYLEATDDAGYRARHAAAAAVQGAWQSVLAGGQRTPARRTLERLVLRAEAALGFAPGTADSGQLRAWARQVRGHGPLPTVALPAGGGDELLGVHAEREGRRALPPTRLFSMLLRPWSPLQPVAMRCAVGCALAGYAGLALGVGHPYWAVVSAAAIYQANVTLTWHRVVQRLVGNLCGVALFAAVVPLARVSVVALAALCVFFSFCNEALITRNYWLGSVTVTPMALLVTEFAAARPPVSELISDRVLDTLAGVVVGMVVAVLITNRRSGGRMEQALDATERTTDAAERALAAASPAELAVARRRLTAALVELREAADTAAGEWWQRALPEERLLHAERRAHRTLAATIRRQEPVHGFLREEQQA